MAKLKRIPCSNPECGKGENAVAGEVAAPEGWPYKFKSCPTCNGQGCLIVEEQEHG